MYRNRHKRRPEPAKPLAKLVTSTPISPQRAEQPKEIENHQNSRPSNSSNVGAGRKRKSSEMARSTSPTHTNRRTRKSSENENRLLTPEPLTTANISPIQSKRPTSTSLPRSTHSTVTPVCGPSSSKSPSYSFMSILKEAGFNLKEIEANSLDKDQAGFMQTLDSQMRKDKSFPANVDKFLREFDLYIGSSSNLNKVLENTHSNDGCSVARKSVQECLVRLLLGVECIQPKLWEVLFTRISELVLDEDEDDVAFSQVQRLLRLMRCLDRIFEGGVNICDKLLELIELSTNDDTRREVILLLPDVVRDEEHERVALQVAESLTSYQALIPACLETLAGLTLADDLRKTVVHKVIDILNRADTHYLQVIMKFLLNVADDMEPVIRGIRKNVVLDPKAFGNDGNEALILASTLEECDKPKKLLETWMSVMDEPEGQEWLGVDLVAMVVLYNSCLGKFKPLVVAAFKQQAKRGAEVEADVEKAYPAVRNVLEEQYLDTLLQIVETVFKSRDPFETQHACFWYRLLLDNVKPRHDSQKVLDSILLHIGTGSPGQVSQAICVLNDTAQNNVSSIDRHSQRLMGLLHDMESWELLQVRQAMDLLLRLAYSSDSASAMQDEVIIKIRKYLNHSNYKLMSVVRNSKFRHVFGQNVKRDNCYESIRVSKSSLDSLACAVNPKFLAVIVESGGGAFIVLPLTKHGRVAADHPMVDGHKGYITDIAFCPHDDNVIASASDDCTVKVWQIPDAGLTGSMTQPVVDLVYHQRRVNLLQWHPTANNVLLSAGADNKVAIWNVGTGEVLSCIDSHPDAVFSAAWNWDGSKLVTTCKDKKIRIIDPRTGLVEQEAVCHEGAKPTRAIFLRNGQVFTTGFSKMSEWQYSLREPHRLDQPLVLQSNDSTNGIIFPLYDPDTNMIYLCAKGDSLIRYFEVTSEAPFVHYIDTFTTSDPQRGIGMMPKRGCDVKTCEVASFYRLTAAGYCQVVSMKCPRKSELFQDDLFPPTVSGEPSLSADDWIAGHDADPVLVSLRFGPTFQVSDSHLKPNVLNKMRASSFVDISSSTTLRVPRADDSSDDEGRGRRPKPGRRATASTLSSSYGGQVTPGMSGSYGDRHAAGRAAPKMSSSYETDRACPTVESVDHASKIVGKVRKVTVGFPVSGQEVITKAMPFSVPTATEESVPLEVYSRRLYAELRTLPKCCACDEMILEEEYCVAESKIYHVEHFSCSACDKTLAGREYYVITETDLPLCLVCYQIRP